MSSTFTLPKVDDRDPTPKYVQAREILIDAIRSGRLSPGVKLPSTKEISTLFEVSLITAHKALEGLVETGWLRREVGRGTYVRNDVDLATAGQACLHVGLMIDPLVNINDYYHSSIIDGLRQTANASDRRVEFSFPDRLDMRDKGQQNVCAICIHPSAESREEVERLATKRPTVILGGAFPGGEVASVDCDNVGGGRAAIRHLLGLGHKRVMVLSGPMNLSNAHDRTEGARIELASNGIELDSRDLCISQDSVVMDDETRGRLEQRLQAADRPTAIMAGGFYLALSAMRAARQTGLSVPKDISIVGFDDPPSAPLLDPALTTVRQPLAEMAAQAYRLVTQAKPGTSGEPVRCRLETELIIRGSTGPIPRG